MLIFRCLTVGATICTVAALASDGESRQLAIRLVPSARTIDASDPLYLQVVFENQSDVRVNATHEPTPPNGFLKFEIRKKGELEYRRIASCTENLSCNALQLSSRMLFAPRGQRTTIAIIVQTNKIRVFDGPGDYELRAFIRDSAELTGTSEPIEIKVEASTPQDPIAVERALKAILKETAGGISIGANEIALRKAVEPLDDCELKRIGILLANVVAIRDANTGDGFARARERVELDRKGLTAPTKDWLTLTLANMYRQMKRFDLAQEEARRLPKGSFEREALERVIRQQLAERDGDLPVN